MITVTDKAKERITTLLTEEGRTADHNIRVSVKGGGCSGLMYDLGFDDKLILLIKSLKTRVLKFSWIRKAFCICWGLPLIFLTD